ncbi:MAG: 50S ribosomal protein L35 [Candidatus Bipolaricaulota bacterium]
MKGKTHKAAAKRFKVKPSGRVFHRRAGYVHKLNKKRSQYRRQARREKEVARSDLRRVRELLSS